MSQEQTEKAQYAKNYQRSLKNLDIKQDYIYLLISAHSENEFKLIQS